MGFPERQVRGKSDVHEVLVAQDRCQFFTPSNHSGKLKTWKTDLHFGDPARQDFRISPLPPAPEEGVLAMTPGRHSGGLLHRLLNDIRCTA